MGGMTTCGYCGIPVQRKATGRPPLYCSARCRLRAFHRRRAGQAAASWTWNDAQAVAALNAAAPARDREDVAR
jgi:endogenous inhibitor of DNA gyrase (YacG/DUF329 family)